LDFIVIFGKNVNGQHKKQVKTHNRTTQRTTAMSNIHLTKTGVELKCSLYRWNFTTKEIISMFPLWTFHLYVVSFHQHLHMGYISLSWCDIPELVVLG